MGTRENPGEHDCLKAALPDEPVFVLLARDRQFPRLVRKWCADRAHEITVGLAPRSDLAKVEEARKLADQAEAWRRENEKKAAGKPSWRR